jgi:uncharacterized protein YqgC (DUF456 family)
MEWLGLIIAGFFVVLGAGCLVLIPLGLPGAWVILGLAGLVEWLDRFYRPEDDRQTFAWWVLGVCLGIAIAGEIIEFFAGVIGTKQGGGTKRGMWGALIGGILGAFVLTPFLWFIPVVGSLVGAILGTFIGAIVGELSGQGATISGSIKPATGATIARILATVAKIGVGVIIWIALSVSAFVG